MFGVGGDFIVDVRDVEGVKVLVISVDGVDVKILCVIMDKVKDKLGFGVILLVVVEGDKVLLVVGVIKDFIDWVKVGDLMKYVVG